MWERKGVRPGMKWGGGEESGIRRILKGKIVFREEVYI